MGGDWSWWDFILGGAAGVAVAWIASVFAVAARESDRARGSGSEERWR
jgi:hypothetical protein